MIPAIGRSSTALEVSLIAKDERKGMATQYRKPAPKHRRYRRHDGVPELAAALCGCSLSMVYKVRNRKAKSAKVAAAIEEAERRLAQGAAA
jgi:hypothetical protein